MHCTLHTASQGFEMVCLLIGQVVRRPTSQFEGKDAAGDVLSSVGSRGSLFRADLDASAVGSESLRRRYA